MSLNYFISIMSEETKKSKPKYKYGERYLDLNKYILNLDQNFQSYLNSRNWNDAQKQEFINAFGQFLQAFKDQAANNTDRFYTNFAGSIFDKEGVFSNDDSAEVGTDYYNKRGKSISSEDYNSLKDRKKKKYSSFDANREVASYFNRIAKFMPTLDEEKTSSTPSFNIRNNGFLKWWNDQINPSGGQIDNTPYLNMDILNADNTRGTTKRAEYLRGQLQNYIDQLGDYNFENSAFKSKENYVAKLRAAIDSLANGYDSNAQIALRAAGIGDEFNNGFFSTGEKAQIKTASEQKAEKAAEDIVNMQKDAQNEAIIKKRDQMQYEQEMNKYFDEYLKQNPFQSSIQGTTLAPSYNLAGMNERVANNFKANKNNKASMQDAIKSYIDFPLLASLIRGKNKLVSDGEDITQAHIANTLDWINQSDLFMDPKYLNEEGKSILPNGFYVVPGSEDYQNWSYLAYNPITRQYYEQSMLANEELRKRMAYDGYDKLKQNTPKKENGGILIFQGGGLTQWVEENKKKAEKAQKKEQDIQAKVEETGKTREQVEAAERKPLEEGLSALDFIRIATAAADAASAAAAFIPGYGTIASGVLGAGSTLVNLGADIADESMSGWDVTKNALYGLGMDVVGLIPGAGITGKAHKIVRALKPISKLTMRALQTYGMINSANAFNKLMSNPSNMTVEDWRNLASGLQAISGEARYRGGQKAVNRITSQKDVADVKTSTGKKATISSEDLAKLREKEGLEAQNKFFSNLTGGQQLQREFKGREVNWKRPWKSRLSSSGPEVSERTEFSFLPEDNSLDAKIFRRINRETQPKASQGNQKPTRNFDKLRQLSTETKPLTKKEIATINRYRVSTGKEKLTQQEIEALNQRRSNRAGSAEDNSFQARLARYKQDKKDGKFNSVEDDIKRAKDEFAEATRQQRLAVPTGQGSIVSPDAKEARFIMGLSKAIPTVNPSRPPITNPPAIIPRQQIEIPKPQTTPFNSQRIREGLERAQRERLGRDIGDTRIQRAIESNPERTARLQAQEAYRNVRQYFNMYGVPQYKKPLTGAARRNKQNAYNQLFGEGYYAMQEALRNRPLPHKQSNKKKKTSRDDRRTVKREDGGIIQKYAGGNPIWRQSKYLKEADTQERASDVNTWDSYYNFDKMFRDLSTIKDLNAKDLISTLNSLDKIQKDSNLIFEKKSDKGYSNWNQEFNKTGFNQFFGYNQSKEDWLGPTTYNRLAFLKYLQKKGPIDINGTKISYNNGWSIITDETPVVETPAVVNTGDGTAGKEAPAGDGTAAEGGTTGGGTAGNSKFVDPSKKNSDLPKQVGGYNNSLNNTLLYGLPRAVAADIINKRMTQLSIDNERPFMRDPLEFHRNVIGDIDALFRGQKNYSNVRNFANRMTTSDANLQKAMQLEGEVKGQDYLQQGAMQNNAQLRASTEQALQQEKENANNRWNTAMQNRLSMLQSLSNLYKYRQAEMSKSFDNWDRFWQQMEYDAKQKEQEKKQYVDYFKKRDIQNNIIDNLAELDNSVSPLGAELYKKVKTGLLNPSSITSKEEIKAFREAQLAAQRLEEQALKKEYGIYKKGGKVDIDRFHEQIQKSIDRNEKLLDRLSKSLYGYIKQQLK